jgi:hypothetical protein
MSAANRLVEVSVGQGLVAALGNMVGPWAILVVRIVDFPGVDLRYFHLGLALGLSFLVIAAVWGVAHMAHPFARLGVFVVFIALMFVWYGAGFFQIASGLM